MMSSPFHTNKRVGPLSFPMTSHQQALTAVQEVTDRMTSGEGSKFNIQNQKLVVS